MPATMKRPTKKRTTRSRRAAAAAPPAQPDVRRTAVRLLDDVEALDRNFPVAASRHLFERTPQWKALAKAPPEVRAAAAVEAARRVGAVRRSMKDQVRTRLSGNLHRQKGYSFARGQALFQLFRKAPPLTDADWDAVLEELARYEVIITWSGFAYLGHFAAALRRHTARHGVSRRQKRFIARITRGLANKTTSGYAEKKVIHTLQTAAAADPRE
jgi:hypothetical protein